MDRISPFAENPKSEFLIFKKVLMFKARKIKIIIIVCFLSLFAVPVFAAEIFFDAKTREISVGERFEVGIFLNTEGEYINAVEGKVIFSEDLLEFKEIRDGNSIINFWIERPRVSGGEVLFSGITPGGYSGEKGLIFSLVFQSTQGGRGLVEFRDIKGLLNDGEGTEIEMTISNLQFITSEQTSLSQAVESGKEDTDRPEAFEPVIASDPAIFDGKYFLIFATQDKGSGIGRYEVREGKGPFVIAESPYLLQNQNLDDKITVKAVDRSGNERIIILPPQKPKPWYKSGLFFVILIMGIFIIVYIIAWRFLWKRQKKQKF